VSIGRREHFDAVAKATFAAVYQASFPASEREDTDSLLASIADGQRVCDVATIDSAVVGLAVSKSLSVPGTGALEYLAVDPEHRNRGLGAQFLAVLRQRLMAAQGPSLGYILEVERPEDADGAEQELRRRRIGFYERNGASVIACAPEYRAPDLAGPGSLRYVLMWLPAAGPQAPPMGTLLRELLTAVLTESYMLDPDDALVERNLMRLAC